jgi:hypothetical protein
MARCPRCHPLRYQQLRQSGLCPLWHATVAEWDHSRVTRTRGGLPPPDHGHRKTGVSSRSRCGSCVTGPPLGNMVHVPGCACPPERRAATIRRGWLFKATDVSSVPWRYVSPRCHYACGSMRCGVPAR